MSNLYGIMDIGKGALFAQQQGISVTGHNIANVNTQGYSRQRLQLETNYPLAGNPGQMGTGVRAAEVQRVYDNFIGTQLHNESMNLGRQNAYSNAVNGIEGVFNESTGYGLSQSMEQFWNAWQDLSLNPGGQAERLVLVEQSDAMTTAFQQYREDIVTIQKQADFSICATVEEINGMTRQIADLNERISQAEAVGQNANDYRDQRDLLLDDLALLIDYTSYETDDGKVTVALSSGNVLVENYSSRDLSVQPDSTGFHTVAWVDGSGNPVDITDRIDGGKLKGWLDARDTTAPAYLDRLDGLAGHIIDEVNTLHAAGHGLTDPATGLPFTGIAFFEGSSAADITVSTAVKSDFRTVAASATPDGVPGDNANAIDIANLQLKLTMNGPPATATFDDYFNSLVSQIGSEARTAKNQFQQQTGVVSMLNNSCESITGVSLDEEMVQLVKFQHGYEAAARLISTVDEMMDTVLSIL